MSPSQPEFDLYAELRITRDVSAATIKDSYKRLALAHHPDKDRDNPDATAKFQRIREAYDILGDETKRMAYDEITAPQSLSPLDSYTSYNRSRRRPQSGFGPPPKYAYAEDKAYRKYMRNAHASANDFHSKSESSNEQSTPSGASSSSNPSNYNTFNRAAPLSDPFCPRPSHPKPSRPQRARSAYYQRPAPEAVPKENRDFQSESRPDVPAAENMSGGSSTFEPPSMETEGGFRSKKYDEEEALYNAAADLRANNDRFYPFFQQPSGYSQRATQGADSEETRHFSRDRTAPRQTTPQADLNESYKPPQDSDSTDNVEEFVSQVPIRGYDATSYEPDVQPPPVPPQGTSQKLPATTEPERRFMGKSFSFPPPLPSQKAVGVMNLNQMKEKARAAKEARLQKKQEKEDAKSAKRAKSKREGPGWAAWTKLTFGWKL